MRYSLYPKGLKVKALPYLCGAGEGHFIYVHVGRDGSPRSGPIAGDDVHHAWWESSLQVHSRRAQHYSFYKSRISPTLIR